jgi:hypothetical protein
VDSLVDEIRGLMASGQWVTGRSHDSLALREGVTVGAVQRWAAEASRALRQLTDADRLELQTRNAAHLEALAADAHQAGKFGDAVQARAQHAKLLGLNAPERQHVTTETDQRAAYEAMAGPQRIAFLRENIAELQALLVAEEKAQGIVEAKT